MIRRTFATLLLLAVVTVCGACGRSSPVAVPSDSPPPGTPAGPSVGTPDPPMTGPRYSIYHPSVVEVLAGNTAGQTVVRWLEESGLPSDSLWVFEPSAGDRQLAIRPETGWAVTKVAIDHDWLAWVETTGSEWRIRVRPLSDDSDDWTQIDSGTYTQLTGPDFPTPALDNGRLAYDVSYDLGAGAMDSYIKLAHLTEGSEEVVAHVCSPDQYLGQPSLSGNLLAYYMGEWSQTMHGTVFIYDTETGVTRKWPCPDGVAMITPVVANNWLVWVQYDLEHKENKNIFASRLDTGEGRQLTHVASGGVEEYYHPSLVHGMVTCRYNLNRDGFNVWALRYEGDADVWVDCGDRVHLNVIHGSWITLRRVDAAGVFFAPITRYGPSLDLGSSRGVDFASHTAGIHRVKDLSEMTPPEVLSFRREMAWRGEWEQVKLVSDVSHVDYETVSPQYVICGEDAYGAVVVNLEKYGLCYKNFRLYRKDGVWRVPELASQ